MSEEKRAEEVRVYVTSDGLHFFTKETAMEHVRELDLQVYTDTILDLLPALFRMIVYTVSEDDTSRKIIAETDLTRLVVLLTEFALEREMFERGYITNTPSGLKPAAIADMLQYRFERIMKKHAE
jgi:hypothetical protein